MGVLGVGGDGVVVFIRVDGGERVNNIEWFLLLIFDISVCVFERESVKYGKKLVRIRWD